MDLMLMLLDLMMNPRLKALEVRLVSVVWAAVAVRWMVPWTHVYQAGVQQFV